MYILQKIYQFFTSLKLTVVFLAFAMLLVFFGTLDQVEFGIYEVQKRHFESFLTYWQYPIYWWAGQKLQWLKVPLLGGYTLGIFLLLNLACAHFKYFQKSWKKIGIVLIHSGLVLLIISGFVTSLYQQESQMWINIGQKSNFSQNHQQNELVLIDKTNSLADTIYAIDVDALTHNFKSSSLTLNSQSNTQSQVISKDSLPFVIEVLQFFPNSEIGLKSQNPDAPKSLADQGAAVKMGLVAWPKAISYKPNDINTVSAYVRLMDKQGDILGTWLVSNLFDDRFPPQIFEYKEHRYQIAMRFQRTYFPFALELVAFTHEKYPGTEIPKDFSSLVNIIPQPSSTASRQVLIYMNHPLRYEGYTFYQASYGSNDTASMFQVVKNPGRLLPYWSVFIMGFGLLLQCMLSLYERLSHNNLKNKNI